MATDNTVRTYDPKEVVFIFGTVIATGYMEGEVITIERSGDAFTTVKGADGGVDRVNNNNNTFNVELTLKQTSPTNDAFSTLLTADILGNEGVLPLIIKDAGPGGTTLFTAPQAWIQNSPDVTYGDAMGGRTWSFSTGNSAMFVGSNT